MLGYESKGSFDKTEAFLRRISRSRDFSAVMERYGQAGVDALSNATPRESGLTADSWRFRVESTRSSTSLIFYNTNVVDGRPVAVLLQYGHGTGTGGYVEGQDYINPALKAIFDQISDAIGKELRR